MRRGGAGSRASPPSPPPPQCCVHVTAAAAAPVGGGGGGRGGRRRQAAGGGNLVAAVSAAMGARRKQGGGWGGRGTVHRVKGQLPRCRGSLARSGGWPVPPSRWRGTGRPAHVAACAKKRAPRLPRLHPPLSTGTHRAPHTHLHAERAAPHATARSIATPLSPVPPHQPAPPYSARPVCSSLPSVVAGGSSTRLAHGPRWPAKRAHPAPNASAEQAGGGGERCGGAAAATAGTSQTR